MKAAEEARAHAEPSSPPLAPNEPQAGPRAKKSLLDTLIEMKANPDPTAVYLFLLLLLLFNLCLLRFLLVSLY